MEFAIYYDDGRVFGHEDGPFEAAPSDGVLFVLQRRGDVIVTLSGADHYFVVDGDIVADDNLGPLLRKLGIKFGRWTSIRKYEELGRRVAKDAAEWPR